MAYLLKPILNQLTVLTKTDEYDYLTFAELWQWVLFLNDNTELNDTMDIHGPSGFAVGERKYDFSDSLTINGDFLLFEIIDHVPSYEIKAYDSKMAILDRMIAMFFNAFSSLNVPIIEGSALGVIEMFDVRQIYFSYDLDWDFDSYEVEESLMTEVHNSLKIYLEDKDFEQLNKNGLNIIQKYSYQDISRQSTYDVITHLNMLYELFGFEVQDFFKQLLASINCIEGFNIE